MFRELKKERITQEINAFNWHLVEQLLSFPDHCTGLGLWLQIEEMLGWGRVGWGLCSSLGNRVLSTASDSHSCKLFLVSTCGDMVGTQLLRPMLAFRPWLFCVVYRWPQ